MKKIHTWNLRISMNKQLNILSYIIELNSENVSWLLGLESTNCICCINKERWQHWCIKISISFIMQNVYMSRVRELKMTELHTLGPKVLIFSGPFFSSFFFGLYNVLDIIANSHSYIPSSLPSTHCMWTSFLLAWHPHNFCGISTENTYVLFTFRYLMHFLLFSFNQGLTCTAASTDFKEVFKLISNISLAEGVNMNVQWTGFPTWHKISLDGLTCCYNQSIYLLSRKVPLV